ncbi:MAG: TonB-dependent receptor [Ekhidna sp.]
MKIVTKFGVFVTLLFLFIHSHGQQKFTISGYVKEDVSNELLPGVTIYIPSIKSGVITNNYGFYSITLETGTYDLDFTYVGFDPVSYRFELTEDIVFNQLLKPSTTTLNEVVIDANRLEKESENTQMSVLKLPIKSVQAIPALMGEKDVLKALQLMPGVQSGSEGNSGLYVRGGGPDQNLLILDDAIVYNASHLFGFFSIFNGDALKSIELYKGGFPARFGGRLSSVIKMDMKDGNKEETHGKVGVGLISSSLMLEGPINKGKTSYIVSGRRTYIDALIAPFNNTDDKGGYYFYDLNAKINHVISPTDKIYVSGYFGKDQFFAKNKKEDFEARLGWGNATSTVRWNHQFTKKVFSNASLIFSRYQFGITGIEDDFELRYTTSIRDLGFKYDFDFFPSINHAIKFGVASTSHQFIPSALVVKEDGIEPTDEQTKFNTVESAIYAEDDMRLLENLNVNLGFRLSHFVHKQKQYIKPEPRVALAYMLPNDLSIKASYASMNQYVHLLSNSGIGLPTDLWVSSTDRVKPQTSNQVALGAVKDLPNNVVVSLEGYFKKSNNVISYKEGASFLVLDDPESTENISWEDNITAGEAESYGIELLVQRKIGDFNGWLGYTLSKTEFQFDDINFGEKFLPRYDRRHDISFVGIYTLSERVTLSGTWVYGTGNNFSLPLRTFRTMPDVLGNDFNYTSEFNDTEQRNNFRAEAYHRMDISLRMSKPKGRGVRTWEFSLYNAYSRKNPFFYAQETVFRDNQNEGVLKKYSLFPMLPSISYTYEF